MVRAGNYGGALGDPRRWPGASQIYRAPGLSPTQYESAGKRRDGSISGESSVALRRALVGPTRPRSGGRGKKGGVIACAMAHRASRIAYAMVRDQATYNPDRWA